MKKLYCLLVLLFFGINAHAQLAKKDTSKSFMIVDAKKVNPNDRPLYVIDGMIFRGNIKEINPDNIESINVLKPPGATNIYGEQGKNGVVRITTKKKKEVVGPTIRDTAETKLNDSALYVVDGVVSPNKLDGLHPGDIYSIDILKKDKVAEIFEGTPKSDIVVVMTKAGAIKSYQLKFSKFSKKYKNYLESRGNKDEGLIYMVNGIMITGKNKHDIISKLYQIPASKIDSINVNEDYSIDGNLKNGLIIITVKR